MSKPLEERKEFWADVSNILVKSDRIERILDRLELGLTRAGTISRCLLPVLAHCFAKAFEPYVYSNKGENRLQKVVFPTVEKSRFCSSIHIPCRGPGRRRGRALPSRSGAAPTGRASGRLSGGRSRPGPGLRRRPGPRATYRAGAPGRRRGRAPRPGPGLRRGPGPPGRRRGGRSRPGPGCEGRAPPPVGGPPGAPVPVRGCADGPALRGAPVPVREGGAAPTGRALRCARAGPPAAERWRCVGAPGPGPGRRRSVDGPGRCGEGASVERVDEGEIVGSGSLFCQSI
ncbi:hypothetical protein EVAR_8743_1 [Eumeta japonica]|uniref:Uncharacterized protein n=1 Tax=Eumeta variegata TaxID=151549 RepID=A0A4C1XIN1_EUMVA|nr:hypothetical protein EVAR_8743_1 [Eumeta japonica]